MKTVKKRVPCNAYDIAAVESWLFDKAADGWMVDEYLAYHVRLRKEETTFAIRYRIEPLQKHTVGPTNAMKDLYAEAGWKYIGTASKLMLWESTRPDAEEPHTDPILQSETYQWVLTRLTYEVIAGAVAVLGIVGFLIYAYIRAYRDGFLVLLVCGSLVRLTIGTLMYGCIIAQMVMRMNAIKRIKETLADGIGMEHQKDYRGKGMAYNRIDRILVFVMALLLIWETLDLGRFASDDVFADESRPLPIVSLNTLEEDAINGDDLYAWDANPYERQPFLPAEYKFRQKGWVSNRGWKDIGGPYRPEIRGEYYGLTIGFLVEPLLEELAAGYQHGLDNPVETELSHPTFDRVILVTGSGHTSWLVASREKTIISIEYTGEVDLSTKLYEIADAFMAWETTEPL